MPSHSRRLVLRIALGGATLAVLGVLVGKLAFAPVHGVHSAAACDTAYVEARTRTDSIAVDLLSYPDPTGHGLNTRCGMARGSGDVPVLRRLSPTV